MAWCPTWTTGPRDLQFGAPKFRGLQVREQREPSESSQIPPAELSCTERQREALSGSAKSRGNCWELLRPGKPGVGCRVLSSFRKRRCIASDHRSQATVPFSILG